jgi:Fe-S-cluster containining protein
MATPPLRRGFVLARTTPFSYRCQACSRCCRNKGIRINPYEVARLAEALGTTTTDVLARWTTEGGSMLAAREDGTCVFLGAGGCTVHAGRPLVCRLYPLGRSRDPDGAERFAELEPVADSDGVYGEDGSIDDYLRSQGVGPFLLAADRYVEVLKRMLAALARRPDVGDLGDEAGEATRRAPAASDESLLDLDAVVKRRCAERGVAEPRDVEGRTEMHLEALEAFAAGVAGGGGPA